MRRALLVLWACGLAPGAEASEPPRQRAGPYEVTLLLRQPILYAGEEMEIEFRVERADGASAAPVAWARIRGVVDMPSMPAMARFDEMAHPEDIVGVYGVHPTFAHGGDYRLCLTILPPVGAASSAEAYTVEFPLTVQDATSSPTREGAKIRPFVLEVIPTPRHPVAGEPVELELSVRMASSFELREVTDFDIQHEKLMHLFIVSEDLADFAHEHPEPAGKGVFRLTHRFDRPGRYRLFADVAPRDAGSQVLSTVLVVGASEATGAAAPSRPGNPRPDTEVALELPEGGVPAGQTVIVTAVLRDARGRPVRDLEPWLGTIGHLMLVHRDGVTFAHAHPDERERGAGRDGRIPFLVRLEKPGPYKGWLQFQRKGAVETLELSLEAISPAGAR